MAFPSVVARTSLASVATNATTWDTSSATLGGAVGDLLIAVISSDGTPTLSAATNAPNGTDWTKLGQASNSTVVTGAIFYKFAESATWGSAADRLTINSSASEQYTGVFLRLSGSNLQIEGANSNGSSTNSNPPNLNLAGGIARDALWIATRSGDVTTVATAAPANYSNLQTRAASGGGGASTNTAERSLIASAEDPAAFTSATEQWVCWTLAIYDPTPDYLYKGSMGWAARYKGTRSDAALYKGTKVLHG